MVRCRALSDWACVEKKKRPAKPHARCSWLLGRCRWLSGRLLFIAPAWLEQSTTWVLVVDERPSFGLLGSHAAAQGLAVFSLLLFHRHGQTPLDGWRSAQGLLRFPRLHLVYLRRRVRTGIRKSVFGRDYDNYRGRCSWTKSAAPQRKGETGLTSGPRRDGRLMWTWRPWPRHWATRPASRLSGSSWRRILVCAVTSSSIFRLPNRPCRST